jgi:hypothetical protein
MKIIRQLSLVALCFLVGCGAPEILTPRAGAVPPGIDLSGNWQIQPESLTSQRRIREAIRKTDGIDDDALFGKQKRPDRNPSRGSGRVKGGLVHVFLELGESLKVTQTADGLFISFDRSVVEEFRFGENRMVNVGQVQAQRVTGWEGDTLVVDTLDRNHMKLTERFRLTGDNKVLERTIILRSREQEEVTVIQRFDWVADLRRAQ